MERERHISILSMQRVVNYGSVLQAYSLRQLIREETGACVSFLDVEEDNCLKSLKSVKEAADYKEAAAYPKGLLQRAKRFGISKLSAYNKKLIRRFMKEELHLDEVPKVQASCVVIGSDEVFNHRNGVCLQLHGDLPQAETCISYAASCGSALAADVLPEDRQTVASALGHISAISVRDEATARYVRDLTGRETVHHLDPVLVGDLYQRSHRPVPLKHYLLVYAYGHRIRTEEEISAIENFAKKHHLKTVAMGGSQFWCDYYIPASPMRMLDYFYHADYVVTDTFHGAVFSVINGSQFAVISRKTNQAKITGLLEDLGLKDRLMEHMKDLETVLTTKISYAPVEKILEEERKCARAYLKKHLSV